MIEIHYRGYSQGKQVKYLTCFTAYGNSKEELLADAEKKTKNMNLVNVTAIGHDNKIADWLRVFGDIEEGHTFIDSLPVTKVQSTTKKGKWNFNSIIFGALLGLLLDMSGTVSANKPLPALFLLITINILHAAVPFKTFHNE